ncbi:MAG: M24 family metallopeptidase [Dehalococcoidia bacterium]
MPAATRIDRLRAHLDELGVDALLITTPSNRRWISGFTGTAGTLLVSREHARFATDARYFEQVAAQAAAFTLVPANGPMTEWAPALLEHLGGKRVGFEPAGLTYASFEEWKDTLASLPDADRPAFVPAPRAIEALRAIKEPDEVDLLTRAVLLGDAAFTHAASTARAGMSERELAWEVQRFAMEHGADDLSFPTIIAGGAWGALPHAYPRVTALEPGTGVVMDLGVVVEGYCSDLTRTIVLGEPDARFREIYDIVLTAQEMAEERIEAGMTGEQAHQIAARVIAEAGYGEYFGHGLGHGVGLDIHEAPRLGPRSADVLADGQVVTVEPGIYIPGWGGVRIEDQCVMEGGRLRRLSTAAKLN